MYSLFKDNVPAIALTSGETTADYLDDDLLDGVMPVLFADNVHTEEAAICEAPLTAKRDLERLAKVLCPGDLGPDPGGGHRKEASPVGGPLLVQEPQP
jgi:hypothetical protein